ncbi:MAG: AGE family epimerase/isomerase [Candidatus Riflebacteria bacterium]|nr:AGE family epimerase/isomerase [Candidatus Riflebacteria bacterium]
MILLFVILALSPVTATESPPPGTRDTTVNELGTPYSDLVTGQVRGFERSADAFSLQTADGRMFHVELTPETLAWNIRNLGESKCDCSKNLRLFLKSGRTMSVYGTFYPEGGICRFEAQKLYFLGSGTEELRFEEPDWWTQQIRALANFYLNAQFPDGKIDYKKYRTNLKLDGGKYPDTIQEADTISRLVYGLATAYMMTGEERYLEAAREGTAYLRQNFRKPVEDGILWYHALEILPGAEHPQKHLASLFKDDFGAIPLYEQIYALLGPVQTMRITGDPAIRNDVTATMRFFDAHFRDREHGGFYSHIDPLLMSPLSPGLGKNRARKNWNSIGDHIPAYLINYYLATGDEASARLLIELGKLIVDHFPGEGESPFMRERFKADWKPDETWGWQKDRAVIGHNLKIAWNMTRLFNLASDPTFIGLAERLGAVMPSAAADRRRGGWYDVVERRLKPGTLFNRFVWHDRKVWWQQEQAILAYQILAGVRGDAESLRQARDSAAFYNLWFLDHDNGGVYSNVTADGLPYLRGDELQKGSHSMSGYHAFELCYLASVYTNLLIHNRHLDLYFKPDPGAFRDGILRVAPDLLPPGRVRLAEVHIDGKAWTDFDPVRMTVHLPTAKNPVRVRVRLVRSDSPLASTAAELPANASEDSSVPGSYSSSLADAEAVQSSAKSNDTPKTTAEKKRRTPAKKRYWFSRRSRNDNKSNVKSREDKTPAGKTK